MNTNSFRLILLGGTFAGGVAFGEACTSTSKNENHCSYLDGDATCLERYGAELGRCGGSCVDSEHNDGCVEDIPTECWYPCGNDMLADDDDSCVNADTGSETLETTMDSTVSDPSGDPTTADDSSSVTASTMTQGSETDPTDTSGPTGCQSNDDCTEATSPICLDNLCVPCNETPDADLACSMKDAGAPVCNDATGGCIKCEDGSTAACSGTTPICDLPTNTCVGCTFHEECPGTACEIATGACFDDACVIEIDGTSIESEIADGCVLRVQPGSYAESVTVDGGVSVAILAATDVPPLVAGELGNASPGFDISGGAEVYIQGLRIDSNDDGLGVSVDGASLWLDRTRVTNNDGGGIALTGSSSANIRNAFIGGDTNDVAALDVTGSSVSVVYSTLVGAEGLGAGVALRCSSPDAVVVRNSILAIVGSAEEIQCAEADVTYSATEGDTAGMGNVAVGNLGGTWFTDLADDFHLETPPAEILTAAQWQAGDPLTDIDGDARPDVDGTADVAGADIP